MSYIGNQPTSLAFVTDQFSGTGSQTAFTMSVAPANASSVLVAVTGVLQDPSTYSVSGTTLTFSAAPPSGTGNISVRYLGIPASGVTTTAYRTVTEFTATAGQTSFSVPSYTVGYIDVYRNGSKLGTADFTATTGTTVVLATGALAGDIIQTVSFYVSSVLNAIPATAGAVNSTYITDAAVTQAKLGTGVAGNGPAFSAYELTQQTISNSTLTKVVLSSERFDTNSCWDTSNYKFTPTVAGYYYLTLQIRFDTNTDYAGQYIVFFKNGVEYKRTLEFTEGSATGNPRFTQAQGSVLVYMNGTTDYIEPYVFANTGSSSVIGYTQLLYCNELTGYMVRAA